MLVISVAVVFSSIAALLIIRAIRGIQEELKVQQANKYFKWAAFILLAVAATLASLVFIIALFAFRSRETAQSMTPGQFFSIELLQAVLIPLQLVSVMIVIWTTRAEKNDRKDAKEKGVLLSK